MPESLQEFGAELSAFLPDLLLAIGILLIGWLIAYLVSKLVQGLLNRTSLDDRLAGALRGGQPERVPVERWIALVVFWLIFLFAIVTALNTLDLGAISGPIGALLTDIIAFIPNLLAAAALVLLAFVVASVLRLVVTRLLSATPFSQRLSENANVDSRNRIGIAQSVGSIVFWLVFLFFLPAILDALDLRGILAPIQNMVDNILGALPALFAAFLLLAVAYFVARLVGSLVTSILSGIGFNRLFAEGGPIPVSGVVADVGLRTRAYPAEDDPEQVMRRAAATEPAASRTTPAGIVGWIVMVAILLFAAMEAANLLGFGTLTTIIGEFIVAAWNILFGLIIFGLGLWLGNLVYRMVRNTGATNAHLLATIARVAVIIFAGALALREMGIAESIVNLAFGLLLGAVAVAAALAFGLGGRDFAGQVLERWRSQVRLEATRPNPPIPTTGVEDIDVDVSLPRSSRDDFDSGRLPGSDMPDTPGDRPRDFDV
jgi:hypothetical protein